MVSSLLIVYLLLSTSTLTRAGFIFDLEVVSYSTNGDCFGIDFTIPCETFVTDFCLRGADFRGGTNGNNNNCPLGVSRQAVYGVPQTRTIESDDPWPGVFQLYIRAYDDDSPLTTHDHLDNIFIDRSRVPSSLFSTEATFPGVNNKVSVNVRYRVTCQQHFYGTNCFEYCVAEDEDILGHYTCDPSTGEVVCRDGYEHPDTFCVDRITACSSFPCEQDAPCTPIGLTDFTCACPSGYTGKMCEVEINECEPDPCSNGGNCTDLLADYSCTCQPGYSGKNCTENIDECLDVDCVGNATCVDGINNYTCVCNLGYEGINCTEINPCDNDPCAATGLCDPIDPFQYSCLCDRGYTGTLCESNIDECVNASCPENSNCVDGVDMYVCSCPSGFEGSNCTRTATTIAGATPNTAVVVGAAVGCLVGLILLILIIILIVAAILTKRERSKRHYNIPESPSSQEGENPYEIRPPHDPDLTSSNFSQSGDPLINNPLYGSTSPEHIPGSETEKFVSSTNIAYASPSNTLRDINNPLYGSDTLSPIHKGHNSPIYSEPVLGDSTAPQKGTEGYPYSYAVVDRDRRTSSKNSSGSSALAPPPNYEVAVLDSKPVSRGGPHYEDVEFKGEPNGTVVGGVNAGYDTPKPVNVSKSSVPAPLVYHYATGETDARATTLNKPPLLGDAVAKSRVGPPKKSIYDSQDESTEVSYEMKSKPVPPPRTKPAVAQKPQMYSYATTESGKRSIKVKTDDGTVNAPYNKLEHDLGPGMPVHQERLAKVEGSGYEAIQND